MLIRNYFCVIFKSRGTKVTLWNIDRPMIDAYTRVDWRLNTKRSLESVSINGIPQHVRN